MLSVGQLGVASADYYLRAVARSTVDYYTGHGEAPGYWLGEGSARLGLSGDVSAEALRNMVYGYHPATGLPLAENAGAPGRRPGFDVTFSAPKSASLLYALGDDATRAAFVDALDLFGIGYSWGGYESLAIPADPVRTVSKATAQSLIRLHIGLEDPDDLIADLTQAFEKVS